MRHAAAEQGVGAVSHGRGPSARRRRAASRCQAGASGAGRRRAPARPGRLATSDQHAVTPPRRSALAARRARPRRRPTRPRPRAGPSPAMFSGSADATSTTSASGDSVRAAVRHAGRAGGDHERWPTWPGDGRRRTSAGPRPAAEDLGAAATTAVQAPGGDRVVRRAGRSADHDEHGDDHGRAAATRRRSGPDGRGSRSSTTTREPTCTACRRRGPTTTDRSPARASPASRPWLTPAVDVAERPRRGASR